ncbi:MAG: hypothetical protein IKS28_04095 [Clostridia bacterium]|nr:hypothetical protein [Clostridia bacterium]
MKKALILLTAAILLISSAACGKAPEPKNTTGTETSEISEASETSVKEETSAVNRDAETMPNGKKNKDITTVSQRETSPEHLSTITDPVTTKAAATTKKETTKPAQAEKTTTAAGKTAADQKPTEKTTAKGKETSSAEETTSKQRETHPTTTQAVPKNFNEPEVDYGGKIDYTVRGSKVTFEFVSHKFSKNDKGYNIHLRVKTDESAEDARSAMVSYNLYDKNGDLINKKPLSTVVILSSDPEKTTECLAVTTEDTAKVTFFAYEAP